MHTISYMTHAYFRQFLSVGQRISIHPQDPQSYIVLWMSDVDDEIKICPEQHVEVLSKSGYWAPHGSIPYHAATDWREVGQVSFRELAVASKPVTVSFGAAYPTGETLTNKRIYGRFSAPCTKHDPDDNGFSCYCRKCDAKLYLKDLEWVAVS